MTSKNRRLASRATRKGAQQAQIADAQTAPPAAAEPPPILPSPLGMLAWRRLKQGLPDVLRGHDEWRDYGLAANTIIRHTVVREKILADLVLRLDNLHTVAVKDRHYSDEMARRYLAEKLEFIIDALNGAVIHDIAAEQLDAGE